MRKIFETSLFKTFLFVLIGCSTYAFLTKCTTKIEEPSNVENSRIKIVEHIAVNGVSYKIIKVDTTEYFVISHGGVSVVKHSK